MSIQPPDDPERTTVLVPIRSFDDAKSRLAPELTLDQRRLLVRRMAEIVVAAAHDLPVRVVTDDPDVAEWATTVGSVPLAVEAEGLNPSITRAVEIVGGEGIDRVIVAHADLPIAADIRVVVGAGVAVAPDRSRDGSNVLSVPTGAGFNFAYGPGSFAKHRAEAARLGLTFLEIDDASLAWDIDDPADLPSDWPRLFDNPADLPTDRVRLLDDATDLPADRVRDAH